MTVLLVHRGKEINIVLKVLSLDVRKQLKMLCTDTFLCVSLLVLKV